MRLKPLLAKLRRNKLADWNDLAWIVGGYLLLGILTAMFALACSMGKPSAAIQLFMFCTVLLYVLPPRSR
jgi:hypothetical protein